MAQLSIKDPFESATKTKPFKTDLEERPEFVVRKVCCSVTHKNCTCQVLFSLGKEEVLHNNGGGRMN